MQKNTSTRAAELKTSGLRATLPRLKVMEIFEREQWKSLRSFPVMIFSASWHVSNKCHNGRLLTTTDFGLCKAV